MRIFLTGASGFIGARILTELLAAGHQVTGLARTDSSAQALSHAGADVHRGTLDEPDTLAAGAQHADAVIHTAFDHDFHRFVENCEKDRRVSVSSSCRAMGVSPVERLTSRVAQLCTGRGA